MVENRMMTILFEGRTEEDILEVLDEKGVKYSWEFSAVGEDSVVEYTMDKTYRVEFVKGICKKVLTNK
mgnify:CR=1 FL=1